MFHRRKNAEKVASDINSINTAFNVQNDRVSKVHVSPKCHSSRFSQPSVGYESDNFSPKMQESYRSSVTKLSSLPENEAHYPRGSLQTDNRGSHVDQRSHHVRDKSVSQYHHKVEGSHSEVHSPHKPIPPQMYDQMYQEISEQIHQQMLEDAAHGHKSRRARKKSSSGKDIDSKSKRHSKKDCPILITLLNNGFGVSFGEGGSSKNKGHSKRREECQFLIRTSDKPKKIGGVKPCNHHQHPPPQAGQDTIPHPHHCQIHNGSQGMHGAPCPHNRTLPPSQHQHSLHQNISQIPHHQHQQTINHFPQHQHQQSLPHIIQHQHPKMFTQTHDHKHHHQCLPHIPHQHECVAQSQQPQYHQKQIPLHPQHFAQHVY